MSHFIISIFIIIVFIIIAWGRKLMREATKKAMVYANPANHTAVQLALITT